MLRLEGLAMLVAVAAVGCDGNEDRDAGSGPDAGRMVDASVMDAGPPGDGGPDAGPDAARPDAGPGFDGGTTTFDDGGVRPCPTSDLGSAVGVAVASGDALEGNDYVPSCAEVRNGDDAIFAWVAPSAGRWTFDTLGTEPDTVLAVTDQAGCPGATELACNDDTPEVIQSAVRLDLAAGDAVYVVVDEFRSFDRGAYVLSIHLDAPETETTCDDTLDEDRDGVADCADPDCAGVAGCP